MNRSPMAHREPSRLRENLELVAFLLVVGMIVIALCAVDPSTVR